MESGSDLDGAAEEEQSQDDSAASDGSEESDYPTGSTKIYRVAQVRNQIAPRLRRRFHSKNGPNDKRA